VVGDEPAVGSDVVEVGGTPVGEELDELGVERHEAVVAELADGDSEPVAGADVDDSIGGEAAGFRSAQAGAGQQLDDEPVPGVGGGSGGDHELGGSVVVEEPGQRVGPGWDVAFEDRVASGCVVPVPLDDPSEERAEHVEPLGPGVGGEHRALLAGLVGEPHGEVFDVVAGDRGEGGDVGVFEQPERQLPQRDGRGFDAAGCEERRGLGEIAAHRRCHPGCPRSDDLPVVGDLVRRVRHPLRSSGHRVTAWSWMASISATAAWSASMAAEARRYSPASQSLVRCRYTRVDSIER
jgi:hypothetical protein